MVPLYPDLARSSRRILGSLRLLILTLVAVTIPSRTSAGDSDRVLNAWLEAQTNFQSWSADFVQTRTLKTLTTPLCATGHVWFTVPNRFRWELGQPAQTIAIRQPDYVWIQYPRLKRAEKYSLGTEASGPWKDAMALFDAGFPRSRADLEQRFQIIAVTTATDRHELKLQPRSAQTRRFLPQIKLGLDLAGTRLLSTEMTFQDGSTVRNDFTNIVVNGSIDPAQFEPRVPADWQVTEPAARRGASGSKP